MSEPHDIVMALKGDFGFWLCISEWRFVLSISYGFFSLLIARVLEEAIPEDKDWIKALFNHRAYRIFAVLFKVATSIELPKVARKPTGNTEILTKNPS